jgi:hypothetical protein
MFTVTFALHVLCVYSMSLTLLHNVFILVFFFSTGISSLSCGCKYKSILCNPGGDDACMHNIERMTILSLTFTSSMKSTDLSIVVMSAH